MCSVGVASRDRPRRNAAVDDNGAATLTVTSSCKLMRKDSFAWFQERQQRWKSRPRRKILPVQPAGLLDLPNELISKCLLFVGPGHYRYVAASCHKLQAAYIGTFPEDYATTSARACAASKACAKIYLQEAFHFGGGATGSSGTPDSEQIETSFGILREFFFETGPYLINDILNHHLITYWAVKYGFDNTLKWILSDRVNAPTSPAMLSHAEEAEVSLCRDLADKVGLSTDALKQWIENVCVTKKIAGYVLFTCIADRQYNIMRALGEGGNAECLNHILSARVNLLTQQNCMCAAQEAVKNGNLTVLEGLYNAGYQIGSEGICALAAAHGQLQCLKYLHEKVHSPWNRLVYINAMQCGSHLDMIDYAYKHGCSPGSDDGLCALAAKSGNLPCLKYFHETMKLTITLHVLKEAIKHGQLDCLVYMHQQVGGNFLRDPNVAAAATVILEEQQIECLRYIHIMGGNMSYIEKRILTMLNDGADPDAILHEYLNTWHKVQARNEIGTIGEPDETKWRPFGDSVDMVVPIAHILQHCHVLLLPDQHAIYVM